MSTTSERYCNPRLAARKSEVKSIDPKTVTYVSKEDRATMNCVTPKPVAWWGSGITKPGENNRGG